MYEYFADHHGYATEKHQAVFLPLNPFFYSKPAERKKFDRVKIYYFGRAAGEGIRDMS
jgi:hypothetical protein